MAYGHLVIEGAAAGTIQSMHRTQAQADAAALALGVGYAAVQGAIDIGQHAPGTYWDGSDILGVRPLSTLPDLDHLKAEARMTHADLRTKAAAVTVEGWSHAAAEGAIVHDYYAFAHHGLYVVLHSATWTTAQKIAQCQNTRLGPLDVASTPEFFQRVQAGNITVGPVVACMFAEPAAGVRLNVLEIINRSGILFTNTNEVTDVSDTQLASGDWVEDVTL